MSVVDVLAGRARWAVLHGDVLGRVPGLGSLRDLPDRCAHVCVTSIPYWNLRSYLPDDHPLKPYEIGLERTPEEYLEKIVACFREVRRVLRDDGTLWVNVGDTYNSQPSWGRGRSGLDGRPQSAVTDVPHGRRDSVGRRARGSSGLKPKDLVGVPWMVAFALRGDGWYLRRDHVWHKPNAMPESVFDRCATDHEYVFQFSKRARYYFDAEAIREPTLSDAPSGNGFVRPESVGHSGRGSRANPARWQPTEKRNRRSVWSINTEPYPGEHFATWPTKLVEIPIRAGTSERGCCSTCGAPWRRLTTVGYENPGNRTSNGPRSIECRHIAGGTAGYAVRKIKIVETTGWAPGCACGTDEPIPSLVLDLFNGSGRSGVAAMRLGRRYVGLDLDPDSIEQSRAQIVGDAPMFNAPAIGEAAG